MLIIQRYETSHVEQMMKRYEGHLSSEAYSVLRCIHAGYGPLDNLVLACLIRLARGQSVGPNIVDECWEAIIKTREEK